VASRLGVSRALQPAVAPGFALLIRESKASMGLLADRSALTESLVLLGSAGKVVLVVDEAKLGRLVATGWPAAIHNVCVPLRGRTIARGLGVGRVLQPTIAGALTLLE